jgi:hypothetical protein
MRVCILNVYSTATDGGNVYGVQASGTTTNPSTLLSTNAIQRTTINTYSSTTGSARALYVNGACQFAVRDSVYFAGQTGAAAGTNIIGVEVGNTSAFVSLKTSTVSGFIGDIMQPSLALTGTNPVLQLTATDLVNANSINGFGTNVLSNQTSFSVIGSISNNTYYLTPGNISGTSLLVTPLSIPYSQKTIVYSMTASYSTTIFSGDSIIITLLNSTSKNAAGTTIVSTTLNNANSGPIRLQNFSSTINPSNPNYLQVQITTNGMTKAAYNSNALFITLSLY